MAAAATAATYGAASGKGSERGRICLVTAGQTTRGQVAAGQVAAGWAIATGDRLGHPADAGGVAESASSWRDRGQAQKPARVTRDASATDDRCGPFGQAGSRAGNHVGASVNLSPVWFPGKALSPGRARTDI